MRQFVHDLIPRMLGSDQSQTLAVHRFTMSAGVGVRGIRAVPGTGYLEESYAEE